MKGVVAFMVAGLVALATTMPVAARDRVLPITLPELGDEAVPHKPQELNWRATQINRCPNGRGGVTLQDAPCAPAALPAASTAAPAVEVVELSALPARPPAETAPQPPPAGSADYVKGLLNGAWKLGLVVLALCLLVRLAGIVRDQIRRRREPVVVPDHGPMPR